MNRHREAVCFLLALVFCPAASTAQEYRSVSVFSPLNAEPFVRDPTSSHVIQSLIKPTPGIKRTNVLVQNSNQLEEALQVTEADANIKLILDMRLFDDVGLKVTIGSITQLPGGTTSITGRIEGAPETSAILTKKGTQLFGKIRTYDAIYNIAPVISTRLSAVGGVLPNISGATVVNQVDPSFRPEANPSVPDVNKGVANDLSINHSIGAHQNAPPRSRRDRMRAKLQAIKQELRQWVQRPIPEQGKWLKQVVAGYFRYHAVPTNSRALIAFRDGVTRLWRQALSRRSQKACLTWTRIVMLADHWLPRPRILHPWPDQRFAVRHPR
jgi:hypothetical protein